MPMRVFDSRARELAIGMVREGLKGDDLNAATRAAAVTFWLFVRVVSRDTGDDPEAVALLLLGQVRREVAAKEVDRWLEEWRGNGG